MCRDEVDDKGSCGPQPFCDGEPSNEWGLEELSTYARMQYRQILDGERFLAPAYWRLGNSLVLAKEAFRHGKWTQYLNDLGIDKTRASKARAIYRSFDKEEDVAGLTVDEAYASRNRRKTTNPDGDADGAAEPKKDVQRLRRSVSSIAERADHVVHDAAFAAPGEAVILIPAIRKAIGQLQELLGFLEQQAAMAGAGDEAVTTVSEATSTESPK